MHGFGTKLGVTAAIALALMAGPALASGVGGAYTDTPSTAQPQVTTNVTGGTNVSVTKNFDTSNNVSVNKEINGQYVGYGLNGANTLNNIGDQTSDAATYNQNRHAGPQQMEGVIMNALGLPVY